MRPGLSLTAPVNAPRACPNSSLLSSSGVRVGQEIVPIGYAARLLHEWIALASMVFPVPLSPRINTTASESATCRAISSVRCIFGLCEEKTASGCRLFRSSVRELILFSMTRADSAFATMRLICSGLNGLAI